LIEPVSSLITCSNSLQALKNFPVQMRRALASKALIKMPILAHFKRYGAQIGEKSLLIRC
jgi:hypothetical protein